MLPYNSPSLYAYSLFSALFLLIHICLPIARVISDFVLKAYISYMYCTPIFLPFSICIEI